MTRSQSLSVVSTEWRDPDDPGIVDQMIDLAAPLERLRDHPRDVAL